MTPEEPGNRNVQRSRAVRMPSFRNRANYQGADARPFLLPPRPRDILGVLRRPLWVKTQTSTSPSAKVLCPINGHRQLGAAPDKAPEETRLSEKSGGTYSLRGYCGTPSTAKMRKRPYLSPMVRRLCIPANDRLHHLFDRIRLTRTTRPFGGSPSIETPVPPPKHRPRTS